MASYQGGLFDRVQVAVNSDFADCVTGAGRPDVDLATSSDIRLLPAITATSQGAIERGLAGSNADKWANVLRRMELLRDLSWGRTRADGIRKLKVVSHG